MNNGKLTEFKKTINQMIEMNMLDQAYSGVRQVIEKFPNDAELYAFLSTVKYMKHEYEEADQIAQTGLNIDSKQSDLLFNRGQIALADGRYTQAYRFFHQLLSIANEHDTGLVKKIMEDIVDQKNVDTDCVVMPKGKKRVLIIAYYFPPLAGSGVQRTLKLVKYLRMTGWEPIVVAPESGDFLEDRSLMEELPEDIRIIRIKCPTDVDGNFLDSLVSKICGLLTPEMIRFYRELVASAPREAKSYQIPDAQIFWAIAVLGEIEKHIGRDSIDLIYTTAGPYSDHIAGYYIKKMYGKPWVADFRDEWSYNPSFALEKENSFFKLPNSLEQSVVSYADRIITVTELSSKNEQKNFNLSPAKVKTITNGYDEEDFEGLDLSSTNSDKFTIMHNGIFYRDRTPREILTAIKNLIAKKKIPEDRIRLQLGFLESHEFWEKECHKMGLDDVVEFLEYLPHRKSLKTVAKAHALLNINGPNAGYNAVFTGKIFEYLRLGKPIISLGSKKNALGEFIEHNGRGKHIFIKDIDTIEEYVYELYLKWEKGSLPHFEPDEQIRIFERKNTTKKFADVFYETLKAGTIETVPVANTKKLKQLPDEVRNFLKKGDRTSVLKWIETAVMQNLDYNSALKVCRYWVDNIDSANSRIYLFMGMAANGLAQYDLSIHCHKLALALDPQLADIHFGKNPCKTAYDEYETPCLGCGANDAEIVQVCNQSVVASNFGVINPLRIWKKCKKCGLIFAGNLPSDAALNAFYKAHSSENRPGGIVFHASDIGNADNYIRVSYSRLEKIEKLLGGNKGEILDIGAGSGIFVASAAERGWQATGLESSETDCKRAKRIFDVNLIQSDFYQYDATEQYDAVTLFEVIEHLTAPYEAIRRIWKMLKPGGIMVLATPIKDSVFNRQYTSWWYEPAHLTFFEKDVMIKCAEDAHFDVSEIAYSEQGIGRLEFYCKKLSEPVQ